MSVHTVPDFRRLANKLEWSSYFQDKALMAGFANGSVFIQTIGCVNGLAYRAIDVDTV